MKKIAKTSADFYKKLENMPKLTRTEKQAKLDALMKSAGAQTKLGEGMVGPVLIKLRFEGLSRSIITEDPLAVGDATVYDILDDLGIAYFLNDNEAEVKVTPFEGKRVSYETFRIASQPTIKKEDLYALRINTVEVAQDESRQSIMKQEDARLLQLIDTALLAYKNAANHDITPDHIVPITGTAPQLTPEALNTAAGLVEMHELEAVNLIGNPMDIRKMNTWGIESVGWKFKDEIVEGMKITKFGEFSIKRSILMGAGKAYLLPEADYLGRMPIRQELQVTNNDEPSKFQIGWVMDELIGQVILNPRGIAKITLGS